MSYYQEDILLILITILCFLIIFSQIYLCHLVTRKIRNQDLTVSLAQPGKLYKHGNNYHISLSQPPPPQPPPPPPSLSETLYENLTEGEPSAPLPPPTTTTPPPSGHSEREEEEVFIQSVDGREKEEFNEERIRHLQVTCEVLKERMVKVERELRKLKK